MSYFQLICPTDFMFAFISRNLIIEASYFTEWRGMYERGKLYWKTNSNKSINLLINFPKKASMNELIKSKINK